MSTEHKDDEHAMIHEGETPEELEYAEDDGADQARLAEEKAKKDKKLKATLYGGLAAVAVVFVGYKLVFPAAKPGTNVPVMTPMAVQAPVVPFTVPVGAAPGATAAAPAGMPAPGMPAPGMPTPGMPVPSGMPAASGQTAVATNADVQQPVGATAPLAVAGVAPAAVAVAPVNDPFKVATVADPLKAPEISTAVAVAGSGDSKAVEGFSRGMDELTKKLDELKAMFTKFDELQIGDRLAKLEARVGALEGRSGSNKPVIGSDGQASVVRHRARPPIVRTAKVVPIGEGEEMLFSRMVEGRQSAPVSNTLAVSAAHTRPAVQSESRGYVLHAVIPGRIWVKNADGNSQTFENGEVLPDGAKILKIDPDRGDVVTSKGVLKFDAR